MPHALLLAPLLLAQAPALPALQEETVEDPAPPGRRHPLDTLLVTASRRPESLFETPYSAEVVGRERFDERAYRTVPQALRDVPGVMVQETAHGHGSPYIRGFTSLRTLFLIDGIRLNNSVFREGPNQYWNTVDPFMIDQLEIVKGPSSVLYGSDAIGGTVNAITKGPGTWGDGTRSGGLFELRLADAENDNQQRAEVSLTQDWRLGLHVGLTRRDFGDLEGGASVGTQEGTGYDELDGDLKAEYRLDGGERLVVARQEAHQYGVPRTHSTVDGILWKGLSAGSDRVRELDQDRELTYAQLHGGTPSVDAYTVSLSYHLQEEERTRVRSSGAVEEQGFEVGTLGFLTQLTNDTSIGLVTWGVEYYHDDVDSFLDRGVNQTPADDIQGPVADDATYDLFGLFLQDEIEAAEDLRLTLGARFNFAAADADSVRDPVTDQPFSLEDDWTSVVGSARFTYGLRPGEVELFGGISQGFRAPNLSDLTRFDTARSNEFEVPAPGLDPEYTTSYEVGVKVQDERTALQTAVFYTDIRDTIVRFPTGNVDDNGTPADPTDDVFEITKDNVGDGWIYGLELGAAHELHGSWTVFGNATFLEGKQDTYPTSAQVKDEEWLDRLMPFTTQLGVRWDEPKERLWAELVATHAAEADRLSTRDEGDTSRIPPGGTPEYTVFDLRAGWKVHERFSLTFGVENLTDEDYRVHGSGVNRPGVNAYVGARVTF